MALKTTFRSLPFWILLTASPVGVCRAAAQLVQPVISEYKEKASGRLVLTNNTAEPMAVVLEPRSFSISAEGHGTFRALDPGIDVQLSSMSVKLQPQESYYVFYKATAQTFPAWFTIYATFSQVHHGRALDVRIQLPHTVYLYQKKPLEINEIQVSKAVYSEDTHQILFELKNIGPSLGRVRTVRASGAKGGSLLESGFPMLPGLTRQVKLAWKEKEPPDKLQLEFDRFSLTPPLSIEPRTVADVHPDAPRTTTPVMPLATSEAKPLAPQPR